MKKSFLALSLLISCICIGQPVIRLYGYSQIQTLGIVRERDPGKPASATSAITHYIFTATSKSVHIRPVEIWIRGQRHKLDKVKIVSTPVQSFTNDVLIPKTTQKVSELQLGDGLPPLKSTPSWLKKMTKDNELVIAYYWNGKKYIWIHQGE